MDRLTTLAAANLQLTALRLVSKAPLDEVIRHEDRRILAESIDLVLDALLLKDHQIVAMRRMADPSAS